ncbi:hypothetical protein NDU88_003050 [Pleurodeles waltl]|uniref:Uncharacterized protein n=1 Tax=Pleurodeles waltl TaxID=8319 RepID=A0AAV7MPG6_PLEWA|nr:hypothetical protein NDU88_003050 [Pleurodeles waltl]
MDLRCMNNWTASDLGLFNVERLLYLDFVESFDVDLLSLDADCRLLINIDSSRDGKHGGTVPSLNIDVLDADI